MISVDPILDVLIAVGVWWVFRRPDPVITVHVEPSTPLVLSECNLHQTGEREFRGSPSPDQNRAAVLHKQPDGTWHEIGHVEFESRENPGERITRELATPGRAIRWPDGTVQED